MKFVEYNDYKFLKRDILNFKKIGIKYLYHINIISNVDFNYAGYMDWLLHDNYIFASTDPLENYNGSVIIIPFINSKERIGDKYPIKGFYFLDKENNWFRPHLILPVTIEFKTFDEKVKFFESFFKLHPELLQLRNQYIPSIKEYWILTFKNFTIERKISIDNELIPLIDNNLSTKINRFKRIKI
jgi:hypothetical protein